MVWNGTENEWAADTNYGDYSFAVSGGVPIVVNSLFTSLMATSPPWTSPETVATTTDDQTDNRVADVNGSPLITFVDGGVLHVAHAGSLEIEPPSLPDAVAGTPYAQQLTVPQAPPPITFSLVAGTLPPGISLSPAGLLSGIPSSLGSWAFVVQAAGADGCSGTRSYTLRSCSTLTILPPQLPAPVLGDPYSATVAAFGGVPPYTFSLTAGALPPGLALSPAGAISGNPSFKGAFSFEVTATDSSGCTGTIVYDVEVVSLAQDYVVGRGLGQPNPNRVRLLRADGSPTPVGLDAYAAGQWGVNVSTGALDASLHDAIVTGPGPGPVFGPHLRAFHDDGAPVAKVNLFAYGTLKYGVNVAAGDVEGDGFAEILTGAGPGLPFGPHVRGWNVDGGGATAIAAISFFAYSSLHWGVQVGGGEIDVDGFEEILTGAGPSPAFGAQVRGFDHDGAGIGPAPGIDFTPYPTRYGVNVAGGDVDADLVDEIATAPGPGPSNAARFLGFDAFMGVVVLIPGFDVTPYTAWLYGGRVGVGDIEKTGRWALVTGPGPDPAAGAELRAYVLRSGALDLVPGTPLLAFPGTFGVNGTVGTLGY